MPESVTDRPTKAHEYIFLLTKSPRYYYDADAIAEPLAEVSVGRYQHAVDTNEQFDPARHKHTEGVQSPMELLTRAAAGVLERGTRNKRSVWTVATQSFEGAHFATFPPLLIEPCVLAGTSAKGQCPACGAPWARVIEEESYVTTGWSPTCSCPPADPVPQTVLDTFTGSGTTGLVALHAQRDFVGIELNPDYVTLARRRLGEAMPLLAEEAPAVVIPRVASVASSDPLADILKFLA